ncbi:Kef family K(+) transporter [Nitrosomonas sp. JL21]|uniref:YbaL family putative K(+) efflux transporter n=1 Tax=Nitrosomonas sp. JL21 TaxID=153949 RepID=UPI00136E51A4|nr:YbaL family putative K(+) efflux transporter [Nitrosomonas sp. JL21]MBL8498912.1 Kef family K(+) transporter [Nitrosomonas sp.]MXS76696.1 Kef family K(+) transporter [Nitrosomonas sp. JL21]
MDHNIVLITTIAAGFGLALIFGFIAERLKTPALVGYLLAGIAISPTTPGFVADIGIASQLSEIGVMLLMFGVGLHFSLDDLLAVKRIALPGAIVQMAVATALGMALATWWGWDLGAGLVLGLSLSCASTVVLLKALESRGFLESMNGQIAVGWLIVEDLVTVLILVLLPSFATMLGSTNGNTPAEEPLWYTIGITLMLVSAFIALMLIVGRRVLPWLLWQVARTGSRELFTLAVVAVAICIAYGAAALFNVSFALGAFFAGMVMRESKFSRRAAEESLPLRDAFAVLFFVSVGMLFDPAVLVDEPLRVLGVVAIIVVGKSLAAMLLVFLLGYPLNTVLIVAASLGQIGEFSFILAGLGLSLGLMPAEGMSLVLAGALISIAFNPIAFAAILPFKNWMLKHSALARKYENRDDPFAELPMSTERKFLEGQVVLVGYGHVGQQIAKALAERDIPYIIAEQNRELVQNLRKQGINAVSGDATEPSVLIQAHITDADMLVIATGDPLNLRQMIDTARTLNPDIEIVLRTRSEDETKLLRKDSMGTVFFGEEELAKSMTHHILDRFNAKSGLQADLAL